MNNKAVLKTISDLSYAGEFCYGRFVKDGIVLKPSPKSEFKIWCPVKEVKCIILPDGKVIEGDAIWDIFSIFDEMVKIYG